MYITKSRSQNFLIGVATLAFLSCSGKEAPQADVNSVLDSSAPAPQTDVATEIARNSSNPGMSQPPEADADSTKAYLKLIGFNKAQLGDGLLDQFECGKKCNGKKSVFLHLVPVDGADSLDWDSTIKDVRKPGFIAALISLPNGGDYFDKLNMHGNETAYLWVGPIPGGRRGIAFYVIDKNGNTGGPMEPNIDIMYCTDKGSQNSRPEIRTYKKHPAGACGAKSPDHLKTAMSPPIPDNGGLWVSCKSGCCEVQQSRVLGNSPPSTMDLRDTKERLKKASMGQ